ncbi:MAG: DUF3418 domain-containing protein, partial [Luteolibacter sp.]
MKALGLPEIDEFPFLDPPSSKAISEGYRTLREVGAIDRDRQLTDFGRMMSRLPVDPRLGRMLIEARIEHCLAEMVTVVAALESSDPRERPADKSHEADAAHARWKDNESDFIGILRLWRDVEKFRDKSGKWRRNALRKYCASSYLNHRRVIEWGNVADELQSMLEREWNCKLGEPAVGEPNYPSLHRSLLAGIPRQFGLWDREKKCYRSALGGFFSIFPGSGVSGLPKRHEWVLAMDLVETNRLWARRVARIDPEWVEQVAPHLCRSQYGEAHWDEKQGAVYGKQRVICGGLTVISGRKIHYGRVDPQTAYEVFLREALLAGGLRKKCRFTDELESLRLEIQNIEHKLRRLDGLWSEEAVLQFCQSWVPKHIHTAASFHKWLSSAGSNFSISVTDILEQPLELLGLENFPDRIHHEGQEFPIYYQTAPGERDDGVTIGIHIDQLPCLPEWLPGWGVDGHLEERSEILLRSLPKNERRICQPISAMAEGFAALWCKAPKDRSILQALSEYIRERTGTTIEIDSFDPSRLPKHLITHLWICNDEGEELAMGDDLAEIKLALSDRMRERFEALAAEGIERSGISTWDGEDLPESVTTPGGEVYPALHDEGTRVGVRIFSKLPEAEESHRSGGARLLCIAHPNEVDYLNKKFPINTLSKIGLARLGEGGTSLDDLILLAAEGAASAIYPRSPAKFQQLVTKTRGRWYDAACKIGTSLDQILELLTPIEEWLKKHRDNRNFNEIVTDLDEQMAWLFRPRFAWRAGYLGLLGYPHRMKAIHSRLARISSMPIIKYLEKMKRLHRWWSPWFQLWLRNP